MNQEHYRYLNLCLSFFNLLSSKDMGNHGSTQLPFLLISVKCVLPQLFMRKVMDSHRVISIELSFSKELSQHNYVIPNWIYGIIHEYESMQKTLLDFELWHSIPFTVLITVVSPSAPLINHRSMNKLQQFIVKIKL